MAYQYKSTKKKSNCTICLQNDEILYFPCINMISKIFFSFCYCAPISIDSARKAMKFDGEGEGEERIVTLATLFSLSPSVTPHCDRTMILNYENLRHGYV